MYYNCVTSLVLFIYSYTDLASKATDVASKLFSHSDGVS